MTLRTPLLLAAVCAAALDPAAAQGIQPGTRVRLTTPLAQTVGRVEASVAHTVRLALPDGTRLDVPWTEVDGVEQSLGRRGRPGRGALIGAGVMTALTVAAALAEGGDTSVGEDWSGLVFAIALPVNAAVGAGLGALVGLAWRAERWTVLPIGPPPPIADVRGGLQLVLRL